MTRSRHDCGLTPGHGDSASHPSRARRSGHRAPSPRTSSSAPSRDDHNGPTFFLRRARLPSAPSAQFSRILAYRSRHHLLCSPVVLNLDVGTTSPHWYAHHVAPLRFHFHDRESRHGRPSLSTSMRTTPKVSSSHGPSFSPRPSQPAQTSSVRTCPCFSSRRTT